MPDEVRPEVHPQAPRLEAGSRDGVRTEPATEAARKAITTSSV
ncbi:hypothetical protein [Streptomyces sp. NPDC004435]